MKGWNQCLKKICSGLCFEYDEFNRSMVIVDIITVPDERRTRIASTLIAETAKNLNVQLDYDMKYIMASYTNRNDGTDKFFEFMGFNIEHNSNSKILSYSLKEIKNSKLMEKVYSINNTYTIIRYEDMGNINYRNLISQIEECGGIYDEDFAKSLDKHYSHAIWNGDNLVGTVEIICEEDGKISLGQFFSIKPDVTVISVLQKIFTELEEKYSDDTKFEIYVASESYDRLVKSLLGEKDLEACLSNAIFEMVSYNENTEDTI